MGLTPLHEAVEKRDAKRVKQLLEKGTRAAINAKSGYLSAWEDGYTPLQLAARMGHPRTVELLLDHGARLELRSENGNTALMVALLAEQWRIIPLLLERGAKVNVVCEEPDYLGWTPLHFAATKDAALTKLLLARGAKVSATNVDGETPGDLARNPRVRALLQTKPQPKRRGGNRKLIQLFDEHPEQARDEVRVKRLLDGGADPNARDEEGFTALHLLSFREFTHEVIKVLLRAGAEVDAKDAIGCTPLHCAASRSNRYVVEVLVESGADVRALSSEKRTPLDYCLANLHRENDRGFAEGLAVIQILQAKGATARLPPTLKGKRRQRVDKLLTARVRSR